MNVFIVALYAVNIFFILLTLDAIWYMIVNIIRHKLLEKNIREILDGAD